MNYYQQQEHLLIWLFEIRICLCLLLYWFCSLLIWSYALSIRWALFIALLLYACCIRIHCIHVLFICALSIRSFYVLFQCVLLKYSLFVRCICALCMQSFHVLFLCALSMCSLYVIFICALFVCFLNAVFNWACAIKVLKKLGLDICRENVTQETISADIVCKLSTADFEKIIVWKNCMFDFGSYIPQKENGNNKFDIAKMLLEYFDWL